MLLLLLLFCTRAADIEHCDHSKLDSSNVTRCTICSLGYSLSLDYTQCSQCSATDPHCLRCSKASGGQMQCQVCDYGYLVHQSSCTPIFECSDANCIVCRDASLCTYCQQGYYLNTTISKCQACPYPDMYDTFNQNCACDFGKYLISNASAGDNGCGNCAYPCQECLGMASNCSKCIYGFFMREAGDCQPCLTPNCIICQDASTCLNCTLGYRLSGSGECEIQLQMMNIQKYINLPEIYYFCQEGCFYCYRYDFCLTCLEGYSRDLYTDTCRKCAPGCKQCQAIQNMTCYLCYPTYKLELGTCYPCNDTNCLNCNSSSDTCLQCRIGYTQVNGSCLPCTQNCQSCDHQGPSKCDRNGCLGGYARVNVNQCAACALGCYSCSPVDVATCLACPLGSFQIRGGQCQICSPGCSECSSQQLCSSCHRNYRLVRGSCYENCVYPCLECSQFNKNICETCFNGYVLSENFTCVPDLSCNKAPNCTICPLEHYLAPTQSCNPCQLQPRCLKCQTEAQKCVICQKGYYPFKNQCLACDHNCLTCQLFDRCFECKAGYYLSKDNPYQVYGTCQACHTKCLTCDGQPNKCTSCSLDKQLIGFECVTSQNVIFQLTLQHSSISEQNAQEIAFIKEIVTFTRYVAKTLGPPYQQNPSMLYVKDISTGSVIVTYMASTEGMDPRIVLDIITRRINDIQQYGGFTIIASQIIANGFQTDKVVEPSPSVLYISIVPAPFFFGLIAVTICELRKKERAADAIESEAKKSDRREIKLEPLESQKNLKGELNGAITL